MIQTVRDVIEQQAALLGELDKSNEPEGICHFYDRSQLGSIVVVPDAVVLRFLEFTYYLNTHFAPGRFPGNGMCIGDILTHQGEDYLAFHVGVGLQNQQMLHRSRAIEPALRSWSENKVRLSEKVSAFLTAAKERDTECLVMGPFQSPDKWHETYAGFSYVGTPSPEFVEALGNFSQLHSGRNDLRDLVSAAAELAEELRPYIDLAKTIHDLRRTNHHKGTPRINEYGHLVLTSPSASGGASFHTQPAGDDLLYSLPGSEAMFIIGSQAGVTGAVHIGGGKLKGVHYVFLPAATPFFAMVQAEVDGDPGLARAWQELGEGDEKYHEWDQLIAPIKQKIIREVVPRLMRDRVLGFKIDLVSQFGVCLVSPVVASSYLEAHREFVDESGLEVVQFGVAGFVLESGEGYGFPKSVFDPEPAGGNNGGTRGKAPRPKVLLVEDNEEYLRHYRRELGEKVTLLVAESLEDGERLFGANPDVALVVMDACVPGDTPNSMPLVRKIRQTFAGPIIASSSYEKYRMELMEAGCDREADKSEVPDLVGQLLSV